MSSRLHIQPAQCPGPGSNLGPFGWERNTLPFNELYILVCEFICRLRISILFILHFSYLKNIITLAHLVAFSPIQYRSFRTSFGEQRPWRTLKSTAVSACSPLRGTRIGSYCINTELRELRYVKYFFHHLYTVESAYKSHICPKK